ncbi:hypothetical protein ACQP2E_20785 [Actinoplanes sp. CA-015351]|uniref:hypothetical protein n=1 Tax=Actinoplanes sp. CA-015351 TaxID=3239897 RepID=UPI003D98E0B5
MFSWRGRPLTALGPSDVPLPGPAQLAIARQILSALDDLENAGIVHGFVAPDTIHWDGSQAHLVDFRWARRTGAKRNFARRDGWAAPEQHDHTGAVHPGNDVYSAAVIIYQLTTGEFPDEAAMMRQRLAARPGPLQVIFADAFADRAERRPSAATMLARLPVDDLGEPRRARRARGDHQARERYRALRERQRAYHVQLLEQQRANSRPRPRAPRQPPAEEPRPAPDPPAPEQPPATETVPVRDDTWPPITFDAPPRQPVARSSFLPSVSGTVLVSAAVAVVTVVIAVTLVLKGFA